MIIAVDGPVAAGKGTLARRLAEHYGLAYLDTGALYRAVGLALLDGGRSPDDLEAAVAAARTLDAESLQDPRLREERVGEAASRVAALRPVREELLIFQRAFARRPPGAVLDGRDIGTVVCPDADVKLFVTSPPEARARRRHAELLARGEHMSFAEVLADLERRDERDRDRAVSPLRPAADASLLETTNLDIEAAFRGARAIVEGKR